jgi:hypothetical protein
MINRRKFLQNSGALALGSLAIAQPSSAMSLFNSNMPAPIPAGIQLYTVTSKIEADLDGTLKKIAEIGYKELESAFTRKGGFYGLKPKEFAAKAKEYGEHIIVVARHSECLPELHLLLVLMESQWYFHL